MEDAIPSLPEAGPLDHPPWLEPDASLPLRPLLTHTTADVCVIGGGVAGLSVAHELARRGADVVLLEQSMLGHGETLHTTAHLVTALDERYFELERLHGSAVAALAHASHAAAIDRIESIVRTEAIDCRFTRLNGYIFAPADRADPGIILARELGAARRAGATPELLSSTPHLVPTLPSLRFAGQAQLQPLAYIHALAVGVRARRGRLYTGTSAVAIDSGRAVTVTTAEGLRVAARHAVLATNQPLFRNATTDPRQTGFRSYVAAFPIAPDSIAPALYWDGYWDEDTPYHYVRLAASRHGGPFDLLIVGGEDHEDDRALTTEVTQPRFAALHDWTAQHFPFVAKPSHRWHGRILEPDDELAFIGRHPDHERGVSVISGDSGNGMTYAAIAAMLLPDLIEGREHPWAAIYDPTRPRRDELGRRAALRAGAGSRG